MLLALAMIHAAAEAQEATSRPVDATPRTYQLKIRRPHYMGFVRLDTAAPRPPRPVEPPLETPEDLLLADFKDLLAGKEPDQLRREGWSLWSNIPAPLPGMPTRLVVDCGERFETVDLEFLGEDAGYAPVDVINWRRRTFRERVVRVGEASSSRPADRRRWWLCVEEVTMRGAEWCRWIGIPQAVSRDGFAHTFLFPRSIVRLAGTPEEGSWIGRVDLGLIDARESLATEIAAKIPPSRLLRVEFVDEAGRRIETPPFTTAFERPWWRVEEPGAVRPTLLGDLTASDGRALLVFTPPSPTWRLHVDLPGFEPFSASLPDESVLDGSEFRVTLRPATKAERNPAAEAALHVRPARALRGIDYGPGVTIVEAAGRTRVEPDTWAPSGWIFNAEDHGSTTVFDHLPAGPCRVTRAVVLRRPSFRGGAPNNAIRAHTLENLVLLGGIDDQRLEAGTTVTVDLAPAIGHLRLRAEGDAESIDVLIEASDGRPLALDAWGRPLKVLRAGVHRLTTLIPLPVGDYRITIADPSFEPWTTQVHIAEGSFAAAAVPVLRAF